MPALEHRFVKTFVSPDIEDVLFYEVRNSDLKKNQYPEYGTLHDNQSLYEGFKLVFIAPGDEEGKQKWFYAKDRADQERHNWQVSYPYAGLTTCPRFTCVFIEPSENYTPIAKGAAHPLDEGVDTPEEYERFIGAVLFDEEQVSTGAQELDSLYMGVRRSYDKVPSVSDQNAYNAEYEYPYQGDKRFPRTIRKYVVLRSALAALTISSTDPADASAVLSFRQVSRFEGQAEDSLYVLLTVGYDRIPLLATELEATFLKGFGYQITRPYGLTAYPRVTWRIPAISSGYAQSADYAACPITGYTGLDLTNESVEAGATAGHINLVRVYDALPGPELPTTRKVKPADIPEKFIDLKIETTGIQPVDNAATAATPADLPDGIGGAVLQTGTNPDGGSGLVFNKTNSRVTITHGAVSGWEMDMETGILTPYTQEVVAAGTAGDAIDADGEYSEVSPINRFYSIKTTRKSTGLAGLETPRTWDAVISYSWPPVLRDIDFFSILLLSGETARIGWELDYKQGYSGPCLATYTEEWSLNPPTVVVPTQMQPDVIEYEGIYIRGFNTTRCLHQEIVISEITGSSDPVYANQVKGKTFPATNYTDWPASIVAANTPVPFAGGYKTTTIEVFSPVTPP